MARSIRIIAADVRANWAKVSPYAEPYLQAMEQLENIGDNYYYDTGESVVLYFLSNAASFRGDAARRIKAELRSLING